MPLEKYWNLSLLGHQSKYLPMLETHLGSCPFFLNQSLDPSLPVNWIHMNIETLHYKYKERFHIHMTPSLFQKRELHFANKTCWLHFSERTMESYDDGYSFWTPSNGFYRRSNLITLDVSLFALQSLNVHIFERFCDNIFPWSCDSNFFPKNGRLILQTETKAHVCWGLLTVIFCATSENDLFPWWHDSISF